MTVASLKIGKREFVVLPRRDYERMQATCAAVSEEDRKDVAVSLRRLNDPRERRIPWSQVKKRAGLT